jgi:hypothetical protein
VVCGFEVAEPVVDKTLKYPLSIANPVHPVKGRAAIRSDQRSGMGYV